MKQYIKFQEIAENIIEKLKDENGYVNYIKLQTDLNYKNGLYFLNNGVTYIIISIVDTGVYTMPLPFETTKEFIIEDYEKEQTENILGLLHSWKNSFEKLLKQNPTSVNSNVKDILKTIAVSKEPSLIKEI